MSGPIISVRDVQKRFGSVTALADINLDIQPGEIFALLGPSGCGKSTLLRILAGLESPTSGEVLLDGKDMTRLPPNRRPINMVFQSYAVFPHMTVAENVAYGLQMERTNRSEIKTRVAQALEQVQLISLGDRRPDQLSGGQRQRVALARALVKQPRVLLLDEPLSALDAKLRDAMRLELVKLQESSGVTFIIVTHDQSEALALADRIAVLESGRLRQIDTPRALYSHPRDAFVADFIGSSHTFDVTRVDDVGGKLRIEANLIGPVSLDVTLPDGVTTGDVKDQGLVLSVRPENIRISIDASHSADHVAVQGRIGDIAFQGKQSIVEVRLDTHSISAVVDDDIARALDELAPGATVHAYWATTDMHLLGQASR